MLNGRILIVSDRQEVVAELQGITRAGNHFTSVVPNGYEAMRLLDSDPIPDVVISDMGSDQSYAGIGYVRRFRELNRTGAHLVITEPGAQVEPRARSAAAQARFTALARPFRPRAVGAALDEALVRVEAEIRTVRAEVWRSMDRLRRELEDARAETVRALALTIAARDAYMHGHCERVAEGCRKVALAMQLSEKHTAMLTQAAQLHEVGKMSVPLDLLQKSGPLTGEQMERVRSHARVGAEIVRSVPALQPIAVLIEHHMTEHCELAAVLSPASCEYLLVGILRVVDASDAMTSDRPYRRALATGYRESLLRAGAGTRYHPDVVRMIQVLATE